MKHIRMDIVECKDPGWEAILSTQEVFYVGDTSLVKTAWTLETLGVI